MRASKFVYIKCTRLINVTLEQLQFTAMLYMYDAVKFKRLMSTAHANLGQFILTI